MKNLKYLLKNQNFQSFLKPPFQSFPSSSIISTKNVLTQQEIYEINLLIPRLCLTNNINTATHLTVTALMAANPPPKSLSLSILVHSLTSQPDLTLPMSLLTKLRHTPQAHPSLTPICTLLVSSYVKKGRPKDALKVYGWMLRPGSPCDDGMEKQQKQKALFHVLVGGLCREGMVFEALRILKDMVSGGLVVSGGLRERVFRSLLREAKVKEAQELDAALEFFGDGGGEGLKKVLDLLDRMIVSWTE
ncbi:hypothetical protein Ddye_029826 [Dipteronia dyeriana]|uniref:Pentatricopeptide repeat-containing protein n=1 Tax=Dipteronia dyeriana TaxID=168575 RepID=A0AAD9TF51_9ROSI|nr:hypothetical protein Ddye_029826 [Dipteronia dyeriana]